MKKPKGRGSIPPITWSRTKRIKPADVLALLRQTTWARERTLEGVEAMLAATGIVIGAWRGKRLVGFARALTDEVYRALLDDVVVDESERGRGIGDGLVRRLLDDLSGVEVVLLRCGEELVPFYERHGFRRAGSVAMNYRKG